jgi:hypothetical protein
MVEYTTGESVFHGIVVFLDAVAAGLSTWFAFRCNTKMAVYRATIPERLPLPPNMTEVQQYLDASPWADDAEFSTHKWNPFALILVFEWITLAFAVCYMVDWWWIWKIVAQFLNFTGLILFSTWSGLAGKDYNCPALIATCLASFFATCAVMAVYSWRIEGIDGYKELKNKIQIQVTVMNNRIWQLPKKLSDWKQKPYALGEKTAYCEKIQSNKQNIIGYERRVFLRYIEYCITAPLLFVAILCMLVNDAPAWMFLNGYWLILICNLFGLLIHAQFAFEMTEPKSKTTSWFQWLTTLPMVLLYKDKRWVAYSYLNMAWICLLVPTAGLLYLIRDYAMSGALPAVVQAMIILLLFSYSMFGIVPTIVYLTGLGWDRLHSYLDVLNLISKFPIPIIVMIGLYTSPAGFMPCNP